MAQAMLKITLIKSATGYERDQMDTARALGLRRMHQSVVRLDTPSVRGMVRKITHLVSTEPVSDQKVTPTVGRHRSPETRPTPKAQAAQPAAPVVQAPKQAPSPKLSPETKTKQTAKAKPAQAAKVAATDSAKAPAPAKPAAKPKAKAAAPKPSAKAPAKSATKTKTRKEPTAK